MKKATLFTAMVVVLMGLFACNGGKPKNLTYSDFIGTWSAEKIQYYNVDHWGKPIQSSIVTYPLNPNDENNSVRLVFRDDRTGAFVDSNIDTVWYDYNYETQEYESYVVNPDTVLIHPFSCSFDSEDVVLYLTMTENTTIYKLNITEFEKEKRFVFEEEYSKDYYEKGFMVRIDDSQKQTKSSKKTPSVPRKPGSLFYSTSSTNPLR